MAPNLMFPFPLPTTITSIIGIKLVLVSEVF